MARGHDHPESEVWEWLGIPYAQPPVGDLRWRAPQPIDAWDGVLETTSFGAPCPLLKDGSVIGEEDCLHLNVWRPRTGERGLPVYVWVHGRSGNNSISIQQGDRLAQQSNLVVVSIQYRLGPLGWLYYPSLHTGDPLEDSGNFGLLDIIRSLQWVQDNIEAFGGDRNNVVLTGLSQGATTISSLLLSETANGLFHKAIIQSGTHLRQSPEEGLERSTRLYDNLTALIGAPLSDPTDEDLARFMRERTVSELLEGYTSDMPTHPFTDGMVIPAEGNALYISGEYANKVPIIVGTNRDEFKFYTSPLSLNEYPTVTAEVRDGVGRYGSDLWRVFGADQFASEITAVPDQPDVYVYRFNWGAPDEAGNSPLPGDLGKEIGALHSIEVPFVLGNWDQWGDSRFTDIVITDDNRAGRKNLSEAIMKYFAAFAHSGNPNGDNLPVWEPFTVDGDFKAIEFDVNLEDSSPKITADDEVFTVESVLDDLDANLEEPTRSTVLDVLMGLPLFQQQSLED